MQALLRLAKALSQVSPGTILEADVGVDHEQAAEYRVRDGVQRAGSKGSDGKRDKGSRNESGTWSAMSQRRAANIAPLKSPVVAAVGGGGFWHRRGVVGGTLDSLRQRRENGPGGRGVERPQRRQSTANKCALDWLLDERLGGSESNGGSRGLGGDDALGGDSGAGAQGGTEDGGHCESLGEWW